MEGRTNRYNRFQDQRSQKSDMAFADSWKQNSVELATTGAIVLGAVALGMNGNTIGLANAGKNALKSIGRGFNRYVDKRTGFGTKVLRDLGVKTFKSLQKMPGEQRTFDPDFLTGELQKAVGNIDEKRVHELAVDRYNKDRGKALAEYNAENSGSEKGFRFFGDMNVYKERARTDLRDESLRQSKFPGFEVDQKNPTGNQSGKARQDRGTTDNKEGGGFKGKMADNLIGSAVAGLGFGAGITAFHGVDRAIRGWDQNDHKKRERSFEIAGSFIKEASMDMDKEANVTRQVYEGLAGLGARAPQAAATGIGYTGVSLGTAAMLKHHKDLLINTRTPHLNDDQDGDAANGPRVIIELGSDAAHPNIAAQMGGYTLSPRVAASQPMGLAKLAGADTFFRNVLGRPGELRTLNGRISGDLVHYKDEAAEALKDQPVQEMIKARYGNLTHSGAEKDYTKELFDSKAQELRRGDITQRESIQDEIARDRLVAGAGGLGIIGGIAGLSTLHHRRKPEVQHANQ